MSLMRLLIMPVALLLAMPPAALAQVGRVVGVQGTAVLERAGQATRILGANDTLEQRDVISVAQNSNGVLEFRDRTRVTLRPNTIFRVDSFADADTAPKSMVLGLVKGGLRAVSGDIAKQSPTAMRIQTNTAILGVRGTEFDARICDADCAAEQAPKAAPRNAPTVVARVIEVSGTVNALQSPTASRALVAGAAVHAQESVSTGPGASAVLAFGDGTRITLPERSVLEIPRFDFDPAHPRRGEARMNLVAGNAQVWTGELAKSGADRFLFETKVGTIRPHGTGFGVGGDEAVVIYTWNGMVVLQTATERIEVRQSNAVAVSLVDGKLTVTPAPINHFDKVVPRPDRVNVDPATFGRQTTQYEDGLYVWVRDGVVVLDNLEVTAGNAARVTRNGVMLLDTVPNFMRFDSTPGPQTAPRGFLLPFFRAPDGSILNTCSGP